MRDDENPALSGTDDAISVTFGYDRKLFRRALGGWWQSVVPPRPFVQRTVIWALIWFAIGIVAMGLWAWGISPLYVGAGMVGAGVLIAIFIVLQRTRMAAFHDVIGTHWAKAGKTRAEFSASGVVFTDAVSRREMTWGAIDAVRGMRGVTVLRSGFAMIAIPDAAMPDGLAPSAFRAKLAAWRKAV